MKFNRESNMLKKMILLVICSTSFSVNAAEPTYTVNCPSTIEVSQQVTSMYPDWRVIVEKKAPHFLSGITVYTGAPEELASLAPEFNKEKNKATWTISGSDRIYVACGYQKTNVRLTQALPAGTTSCTVTYNLQTQGDNGFIPEEMVCQKKILGL